MTPAEMTGIDKQFCSLLGDYLPNVRFRKLDSPPQGLTACPNTELFERFARSIYYDPFQRYEKNLLRVKKLVVAHRARDEGLLVRWISPSFLIDKTIAAEHFFVIMGRYIGVESVRLEKYFRIADIRSIKLRGGSTFRDHILHRFNVFMLGLFLYSACPFIQEAHRKMLENDPECPGCIARPGYGQNDDPTFQFLEQWFNTARWHDIGYALVGRGSDSHRQAAIRDFNAIMEEVRTLEPNMPSYEAMSWGKKGLVVGKLLEIDYGNHPGETHLQFDFWQKAMTEIEKLERQVLKPDHGIISAKLFLKCSNDQVKGSDSYFSLAEDKPWRRFSYRNYIIPAIAIAQHNLISEERLTNPVSFSKKNFTAAIYLKTLREGKTLVVNKSAFQLNFLSAMLVACDELQDFDRPSLVDLGSGRCRLGLDYKIMVEAPETSDTVTIQLQKIK